MANFEEEARVKRVQREAVEHGFNNWWGQDTTRFMLSMIPQPENPEVLKTLMRNAYEAGFGCGSAAFAVDMLTKMMDAKKGPFR